VEVPREMREKEATHHCARRATHGTARRLGQARTSLAANNYAPMCLNMKLKTDVIVFSQAHSINHSHRIPTKTHQPPLS
jgi:hypothetical protein